MSKTSLLPLKPKNDIVFHSYLCDQAGVGYIRTIFPSIFMSSQRYKGTEIYASYGSIFIADPNFYKDKAFIKFQRSATPQQAYFLKHVKEHIQPQCHFGTIYDIDDHLFDIPEWNQAHEYYKTYKESVKIIVSEVDGIVVTNNFLKDVMKEYNPNVSIVKNYLLKCIWGGFAKRPVNENRKPRILYPGSANHFAQMHMGHLTGGDMGPVMLNFIKKTMDKYTWVFVGGFPKELTIEMLNKKIEYHEWKNILEYPRFLYSLDCDLGIAPLAYNNFNRAKSDLKILEYSALQIPGVYTDIDPYYKATMKAKTEEEFISMVEEMAANPDKRDAVLKKDSEILQKRWMEDNMREWLNGHFALFNRKLM